MAEKLLRIIKILSVKISRCIMKVGCGRRYFRFHVFFLILCVCVDIYKVCVLFFSSGTTSFDQFPLHL